MKNLNNTKFSEIYASFHKYICNLGHANFFLVLQILLLEFWYFTLFGKKRYVYITCNHIDHFVTQIPSCRGHFYIFLCQNTFSKFLFLLPRKLIAKSLKLMKKIWFHPFLYFLFSLHLLEILHQKYVKQGIKSVWPEQ